MVKSLFRLPLVAVSAISVAVACNAAPGGADDDSTTTTPNTASSSGSGMGGEDGTGGGDASGGHASTSSGFDPGSGGGGGGETCLSTSAEAEEKPLDMVIVWDRSGSMTGTNWTGTVNAVTQFVNGPNTTGVSVGINFFPLDSAGDQCQPSLHNPPQVPLTALPMGAPDIVTAINATSPGGLTPTYDALHGTLLYLTAHKDANPNHAVIAVLASDGLPSECNTDTNDIAQLASSALGYNGVLTYVIAIQGSNVQVLDAIAFAGGTTSAYDVTNNINLFQQTMEEIRANALGCEYSIPEPAEGEEFDSTKLNIIYTPGGGSGATLPQASGPSDCGNDPGWYYDDPAAPTQVFLCPASCDALAGDTDAVVEFEFGCPTIIN